MKRRTNASLSVDDTGVVLVGSDLSTTDVELGGAVDLETVAIKDLVLGTFREEGDGSR